MSDDRDNGEVIHRIRRGGSLWSLFSDAILAYRERTEVLKNQPPIGETSIKQDLQAIIDMLTPQAPVPASVELIKGELSTVHELVFDLATTLTTDPEKIAEVTASVKAVREKLKTSVDNQTQGDN